MSALLKARSSETNLAPFAWFQWRDHSPGRSLVRETSHDIVESALWSLLRAESTLECMVRYARRARTPIGSYLNISSEVLSPVRNYRAKEAESPIGMSSVGLEYSAYPWLKSVVQELECLARLESDWDSYGANAPSEIALRKAAVFVARVASQMGRLVGDEARPTSISPLPTGGIEIEWKKPGALIAIDVGPDGIWGYLYKEGPSRNASYKEEIAVAEANLMPLIAEVLASHS